MTKKEFQSIKEPYYLVKVSYGGSRGYVHSINNEHINIQFEGPIPEPYHYSEVKLEAAE